MQLGRNRSAKREGSIAALMALILASGSVAQETSPPLPPPRPDRPPAQAPEPPKREAPSDDTAKNKEALPPGPSEADAACLDRLTQLGLRFESRPAVQENSCSVENPVLVSGLPKGVEVSPASLMRCSFAENLARWTTEVVLPEAERHLQKTPVKVLIGTSYQCRNQRSGAKLSEHAFGNGVDVMGFEFAKRESFAINSHPEGSPEAAFQSAVHKEACPIFTTVLGPGADADHGNHLHLDMRARKADYRICQ